MDLDDWFSVIMGWIIVPLIVAEALVVLAVLVALAVQ